MKKLRKIVLAVIFLLLSTSLIIFRVASNSSDYPTAETPTLLASLSPLNVTLEEAVTWLIWTDPNCSGHIVNLRISDMTNYTTIYDANETLGILHKCGSLKKVISTIGFQQHKYQFTAKMTINGMQIECSRYLDFYTPVTQFSIYASVNPYESIPGENPTLTIHEYYPYVEAVANIRLYNTTHSSLWTQTNVNIPSTNGSKSVKIPTAGLAAGSYNVNVTATSALGTDSDVTWLTLKDIVVEVEKFTYYIGEMVNVSIRTRPTVAQAGLQISSLFAWPTEIVVDEMVSLTNGKAQKLYDSSSWAIEYYDVTCNATIDSETVEDSTSFSLETFSVSVYCDEYDYKAGEIANITISTTPSQPNAEFNLTITNSTHAEIWSYGPSHLNSQGESSVTFNTTGLPPDDYKVTGVVNNTKYEEEDYDYFYIVEAVPIFDISALVEPYANTGYAMPRLDITVSPMQTNANLTIEVTSYTGDYYTFIKENFNISAYTYFIPAVGMPNGTYWTSVSVTSAIGTNSTGDSFSYNNGIDTDGDGLPDSQEKTISTLQANPDSDGDGFFDGMEIFHGSDPLSATSVIPEMVIVPFVASLSVVSAFAIIKAKLRKSKTRK